MPNDVRLLLVEDDEIEVRSLKRAFKRARVVNDIVVARDGVEALQRLTGEAGSPIDGPLIILLDLNLPRMNGLEFLAALRGNPKLHHHVVFVLTTSASEADRAAAYQEHVAGFITKSTVGRDFLGLLEMLGLYCKIVDLEE